MKKVAVLQSIYIPWKRYFDMIAAVDKFILYNGMQYLYRARANIVQAQRGKKSQVLHLEQLAAAMQKADKIVLHGLFNKHVVTLLFLMPWLLHKCYWVMWGGDLYVYQLGNRHSKSWKLRKFF